MIQIPVRLSVRLQCQKNDGANDDWTVGTVADNDGIGRWNERYFTMVGGHFGATSDIFFSTTGGDTIPTFNQTSALYLVNRNGMIEFSWNADEVNGTGVGSGILRATLPFQVGISGATLSPPGNIQWKSNSGGTFTTALPYSDTSLPQYVEMVQSGAATARVTPGDWTTDLRLASISVNFLSNRL